MAIVTAPILFRLALHSRCRNVSRGKNTHTPVNPACRILERRQHDSLVALFRAHAATWDLLGRGLMIWQQLLVAAIQEMATANVAHEQQLAAAAAAPAPSPTRPASSIGSMVEQLNRGSQLQEARS